MQELAAFQSRTQRDRREESQEPDVPPSQSAASEKEDFQGAPRGTSTHEQSSPPASKFDSQKSPLKHALPPKPVGAGPPPSFRGRTKSNLSPMRGNDREGLNRRRDRERDRDRDKDKDRDFDRERPRERVNGSGRSPPAVVSDQLPPGWEIRKPRDPTKADNVYYYNIHTEESTWERPSWPDGLYNGKERPPSPQIRGRGLRDVTPPSIDTSHVQSSNDARPARYNDSQNFRGRGPEHLPELSRDDRHYRPSAGASRGSSRSPPRRRNADRSPPSTQNQGGMRDNLLVEPSGPREHRGRSPPRSYPLPPAQAQPRPSGQRRDLDSPAFYSNKDESRGRDLGPVKGAGIDRGWASKREPAYARLAGDDESRRTLKIDTSIDSSDDRRRQPLSEDAPHQRSTLSARPLSYGRYTCLHYAWLFYVYLYCALAHLSSRLSQNTQKAYLLALVAQCLIPNVP